ncbi:MAG: alpha/beta hydrolase [Bacteroidales bacterium]|nr:alpha/beta hydrolase [Bacteroidales bacterium]
MKTKLFFSILTVAICFASCKQSQEDFATSSDGLQISYTDQGSGDIALVFVHGWSCDKSYWKYQVPEFSTNYRVITVDYGGHGNSGTDRENFTINSFGDDVVAVVDKLDLDQVILIGHSMGGEVIIDAASKMPERVIGLVGVDTYQQFRDTTFTREIFESYTNPFYQDFKTSTDGFVRAMFPENADTALVNRVARDMSSADSRVAMQAFESMYKFGKEEIEEKLAGMDIPVYSVNADFWPTNEAYNRSVVPEFKVRYMPGYGHFIMLENPELFNRLLQETIDEIIKDKD